MESRSDRDRADLLAMLLPAVEADPARFQPRMTALLRARLTQARFNHAELLWLAWTSDARELRDLIAGMGTFSPLDREHRESDEESDPAPPRRLHLARQVASLWDDPNPGARLRLLAAFAFRNADRFTVASGPPARRLADEWRRAAAALGPGEARALEETVNALDAAELADYLREDGEVDAVRQLLLALCAESAAP